MTHLRPPRHVARDGGFTLIELLITIVIMGVITLALGNFVIEYFIHTGTATARVRESHDEQVAATYFAQDVANVGTRDSSLAPQPSVWPGSFPAGACGASAAAADQILLLKWDNATWNTAVTPPREDKRVDSVAYVRTVASGETRLQRIYCQDTTQVSSIVVVHNLDPGFAPTAACWPNCTAATTITLQLRVAVATGGGQPFTMTLTGQRRQS